MSTQTILLTGASGGMGSATKQALERDGARVVSVEKGDADLTSYTATTTIVSKILSEHASIDWAVFCHGYISNEFDFLKQEKREIDDTFSLNILSVVYLTQILLPRVNKGIVFISSTSALQPNGRYVAYSASKAAVNAFAQALARHYTDRAFIALCPGATNTAMRRKVANDADISQSPDVIAHVIARIVEDNSTYKSGDIVLVRDGKDSLYSSLTV
jgi:NAD(P)-dependent dehydrogenase (short-subunit alcohol dehydrogenase family)